MSRTHLTQTPSYSYTHVQKRRHTKTPMDTLTRTETTLRCLARVRTRPGAPACYFLGLQSSPPRGRLPGEAAAPPSAWCSPRNGESERKSGESWELDAWIAGLREADPGCQGELGGRAHRIWRAAYCQAQGPGLVRAPRPLLTFLLLGWGGGRQGLAPLGEIISPWPQG